VKKQSVYLVIVLLAAVLLSGFSTYIFLDGQPYQQKGSTFLSREQVAAAQSILDQVSNRDYAGELLRLQREHSNLREYMDILRDESSSVPDFSLAMQYPKEMRQQILSKYSYSAEQATAKAQVLSYCIERLEYAVQRNDYVDYVQSQADKMNGLSVFSKETNSNIRKTSRDFAVQDDILVVPMTTVGISKLFANPFANLIGVMAALLCAGILAMGIQKGNGTTRFYSVGPYVVLFVVGILCVFTAELMASNLAWPLGDLSVPVQSVPEFKSCRYEISLGTLVVLRILVKGVACVILCLLSTALYCMKRGTYLWLGAGALGCILEFVVLEDSVWNFRRLFHIEEVIGVYHNSYFLQSSYATEIIYGAVIIVLLFLSIWFASRKINRMLLLQNEQAEKKYFEDINNRYSEIRMLRHDMNNHLSAMSLLLQEGKLADAQDYLKEVASALEESMPIARTGINALDMVLWSKASLAKESGTDIRLELEEGLAGIEISNYELCSVFGNLLDNALEAVKKLPEEERKIKLSVRRQLDMLCIFCENPYTDVKSENGSFISSKADAKNHGFGIRQIRHIASKYQGTVEINTDNHIFSASVLLTTSTSK